MGEAESTLLRTSFNGSIRIEGRPDHLTANAGVLALREIDERLGFTRHLCEQLEDDRDPRKTQHSLSELVRSRILLLATGFDQQRDIAHQSEDPAFLASIADQRGTGSIEHRPASQPTLARIQRSLGSPENLACLEKGVFDLARRSIQALGEEKPKLLTIDIDSTPIDSHGHQPGSRHNGHYRRRCFHPQIAILAETNHILGGQLRPGNEATNQGEVEFLIPLLDRTMEEIGRVGWIRGDAGFANNKFMSAIEDRKVRYVLRAKNNKRLNKIAEKYLTPPKGKKPKEPREWCVDLEYSSTRWPRKRRMILVIQERPDSMYLHHFFLVTNCRRSSPETLIQRYRDRGAMEGRLGDFKGAIHPALSCTTHSSEESERDAAFAASASTFQMCLMADGLLHTLRSMAGPEVRTDEQASPALSRVRRILVQVPARMTRSARRLTFIVGRATHELWRKLHKRMDRLLPVS